MNLTDIYRIFYQPAAWYMLFPAAQRTFSKTDHILEHEENFNKYKKNWNIPLYSISLQWDNIRNQQQKKLQKISNTWRLNNMLLNDQLVTKVIREKILKFLKI
jgi:hypothetical protein